MEVTQKIIKVGTSGAVTVPAKYMRQNNLTFGDELKTNFETVMNGDSQHKIMQDYKKFVDQYGSTLQNLAKR